MRWWHVALGLAVTLAVGAWLMRDKMRRALLRSATATRLGIVNEPPEAERARLDWLADRAVEVLRLARGFDSSARVSSGYRNPELNAAVDGSPTSRHARMLALDVAVTPGTPGRYQELARFLRANAGRLGVAPRMVIAEAASPHVHVDYWDPLRETAKATMWRQEKPGRVRGEKRQLERLA